MLVVAHSILQSLMETIGGTSIGPYGQYYELVAPQTRDYIGIAKSRLENGRGGDEGLIAGLVSKLIVDRFHPIKIDERNSHAVAHAAREFHLFLCHSNKTAPVKEPGQRVYERQILELSQKAMTFTRIADHAYEQIPINMALDEEVLRSLANGRHCQVLIVVAGQHNDGHRSNGTMHPAKGIDANTIGQRQVEQDQIVRAFAQARDPFVNPAYRGDGEFRVNPQHFMQQPRVARIILDQQESHCVIRQKSPRR